MLGSWKHAEPHLYEGEVPHFSSGLAPQHYAAAKRRKNAVHGASRGEKSRIGTKLCRSEETESENRESVDATES